MQLEKTDIIATILAEEAENKHKPGTVTIRDIEFIRKFKEREDRKK